MRNDLIGTMTALLVGLLPGQAIAGEAFRVLSLSAAEAPAIQSPIAKSPPPSWRTSFGSERKTKDIAHPSSLSVETDVVLLQDVTNLLQVRRAFPAKSWRLIVSRQMVLSDDPLDPRSLEPVSKNPATVVAIRFQPGVRVAGQEHLMSLAERKPLSEAAKVTGAPELSTAPLVAGTAVRLAIDGKFVWVVSVSLDESCGIVGPACPQRTWLNTWIEQRHKMGEAVITGGKLFDTSSAGTECAAQSVAVYPARDGVLPSNSAASRRDGMGCAALAHAGGGN